MILALTLLASTALAEEWEFVQLATGEDFTCGRTKTGKVGCWGNNEDQQLGVSRDTARSNEPVDTGLSGVVDLAAGGVQACVVLQTGGVKCWGQVKTPAWGSGVLPENVQAGSAAEVAAGPARGCARQRGQFPVCWEELGTQPPDLQNVQNVREIVVGTSHACALVEGGNVWCWGDDRKGQLGGDRPGWPATASPVDDLHDVVDIAAGAYNTCAATRSGKVWCWGPNPDGQLGTGDTQPAWGPQQVKGLSQAVEVSVGTREACARTVDGKVFCWGADPCPRPNVPTRRLSPIDLGIRGADALSEGPTSDHRCALVKGEAVCWGFNSHAQAGSPGTMCVARP